MVTWLRNALVAAALMAGLGPAMAQVNLPNLPAGTVVGRTQIGPGPAQAIPFATLIQTMLNAGITTPSVTTNSAVFKGSVSGQATVQAQSAAGTPTIQLPTVSGTIPDSATAPLAISSAGVISCSTCSSTSAVVASRAVAIALNLTGISSIQTQGYASPGDGGGATFKLLSSGGFKDSTVTGATITAGSGCTNGSYTGVVLTGGTGVQLIANVTVSGGIVTAVTPWNPAGNGYSVGDVLTIPSSAITCANARYTVTTVSTPVGSFTDAVGNKFQIVTDAGNDPNVRQFGAKINWINATGDAGATDDSAAFTGCLVFAYYGNLSISNGGSQGGRCQMPSGTALVCSTQIVPTAVSLNGSGPFASVIKQCDSSTAAAIDLGDPNAGSACFGPRLSNIQVFGGSGTPASGIALVFTNCAQQQPAIDNVTIYARAYECFRSVTGLGGAANLTLNGLFCTVSSSSVDGIGIQLGYGAAVTTLTNTVVESGATFTGFGINIPASAGGVFNINGFHCEQVSTCINWAPTGSGAIGDIQHASGGSAAGGCASVITRQSTAISSQLRLGIIFPNGCTATYNNGGTPTTGNVITNTNI